MTNPLRKIPVVVQKFLSTLPIVKGAYVSRFSLDRLSMNTPSENFDLILSQRKDILLLLKVLNSIPNTKVNQPGFQNTYEIISALEKKYND
jgi:hypothetical protein